MASWMIGEELQMSFGWFYDNISTPTDERWWSGIIIPCKGMFLKWKSQCIGLSPSQLQGTGQFIWSGSLLYSWLPAFLGQQEVAEVVLCCETMSCFLRQKQTPGAWKRPPAFSFQVASAWRGAWLVLDAELWPQRRWKVLDPDSYSPRCQDIYPKSSMLQSQRL